MLFDENKFLSSRECCFVIDQCENALHFALQNLLLRNFLTVHPWCVIYRFASNECFFFCFFLTIDMEVKFVNALAILSCYYFSVHMEM